MQKIFWKKGLEILGQIKNITITRKGFPLRKNQL